MKLALTFLASLLAFAVAPRAQACDIYSKLLPDGLAIRLAGTVDADGNVYGSESATTVIGHLDGDNVYTLDSGNRPVCVISGTACIDLAGSPSTHVEGTAVYANYGFVANTVNCTPAQALVGAEVLLVHGG